MPRNSDRKVLAVYLAATLAILASCASPKPPAHIQGSPADPCRKYESPTEVGRCHLFLSADGWQFIPEIGRNADLDTQIRCAPVAPDLDIYSECIGRARGSPAVASPVPAALEPAAGLASQAPAERIDTDVAVDDFEQFLREVEKLATPRTASPVGPTAPAETSVARTIPEPPAAPSTWTAPRGKPTAPATVARIIPKAPAVTAPNQSLHPWCAENGSCYGDMSSYTGRPKTVHVGGYYRKDGTYVRGHYRSRPRR